MGTNIIAFQNGKSYMARPEGWNQTGFVNSIKKTLTLKYEVYDGDNFLSKVEYHCLQNYILIKQNDGNIAIQMPIFYLNAQKYYVKEKLRGFQIWPVWDTGEIEIVMEGEKAIKEYSIEFKTEDANFQPILKEFAIGLMIRWMSYLY